MQTKDFISVIKKYYLDGRCVSAKWVVKEKNLTMELSTESKDLLIHLDSNIDLEDGEFGIYDTDKLLQFLGALDSEISIQYEYQKNKPIGLKLSDKVINAVFMLADISIFEPVNSLKSVPTFDVVINLNKELIDRFIKSKKALPDAKVVAIITQMNDDVDFIINFQEHNTNRITIPTKATIENPIELIAFDADVITAIFSANNGDYREGKMSINGRGLAMIEFTGEDTSVKYYLKKFELV